MMRLFAVMVRMDGCMVIMAGPISPKSNTGHVAINLISYQTRPITDTLILSQHYSSLTTVNPTLPDPIRPSVVTPSARTSKLPVASEV